jgi:ribosomal protein S18 acetylase RimI-like enzyme
MRLGSELLAEVEAAARDAGARGLMLTVHTRNAAARRFYKGGSVGFEVSPLSPAICAPPFVADACDYEILQKLWDHDARRQLLKSGAAARRANYVEAMNDGRLKVRCVMKGGRRAAASDDDADPATR